MSTYSGWNNYPTWCVNLWLGNDEDLYHETHAIIDGQHNPDARAFRVNCADALKTWVRDELAPDLGASFAADLLGWALDHVDWFESADAWIADAA